MNRVHRIKCGNGNCYIIENGSSGVLVDTGKREYAERVLNVCREFNVKLIALTHAHFDHAENAEYLSEKLGVPVAMSRLDLPLIGSNFEQPLCADTFLGKIVRSASLKDFKKRQIPEFTPEIILNGGDTLSDYGLNGVKVIALPGHTEGSIGFDVDEKYLIVGDALFNMFYPTVSMLYHDKSAMLRSAKLIEDIGERTIFFGHGKPLPNRNWK